MLAATSSDQVTLLNTTAADKKLEALPAYKELLQTFITQEASPPFYPPPPAPLSSAACLLSLPTVAFLHHLAVEAELSFMQIDSRKAAAADFTCPD